jgi:tetratricopeptide (TPR) repeat protein
MSYVEGNRSDDAWLHFELGNELAMQGRLEGALVEQSRAIEFKPAWSGPYLSRGMVYEDMGEFERAVEEYSKAISLDPRWAEAYESRARSYSIMGKDTEAQRDIDRAIEAARCDVDRALEQDQDPDPEIKRLEGLRALKYKRYDIRDGWL